MSAVIAPFHVGSKIRDRRFDLDDPELTVAADGSGNSVTQLNPNAVRRRCVPRATASAVGDCRRSGGNFDASASSAMAVLLRGRT
jgi:hypothetical protein